MACRRTRSATPPWSTNALAHSSVGSMLSISFATLATASARNDALIGGTPGFEFFGGVKSNGGIFVVGVIAVVASSRGPGPPVEVEAPGSASPSVSIAEG